MPEIPADTSEGLKAYLADLKARVERLEDRVFDPDEAAKRIAEGHRPLYGI